MFMSGSPKFDWTSFLSLARNLQEGSFPSVSREACLRTAMNRAYFAVFCPAKTHLGSRARDKNADHEQVRNLFKQSLNLVEQSIGQLLTQLHADRCQADYKGAIPDWESKVPQSLAKAQRIVELLGELSGV